MIRYQYSEHQINKHSKGVCVTPYCLKRIDPNETNWRCYCCRKATQQKNNPLKYAYRVLKNNAKKRNKIFTLTFERFKNLVEKNNYMNKRGTKSKSLQIDRIIEWEGYTDKNVQCITLRENVHKYKRYSNSLAQEAGF